MKDNASSRAETLPKEFGILKRRDRERILERLPSEIKGAFLESLDNASVEVGTPPPCQEASGDISETDESWLGACLDSDARRKHLGLRRDFIMTKKAQSSLKAALLSSMADRHEHTSSLPMTGPNGVRMQCRRPSLVARINDFLAGLAGRE